MPGPLATALLLLAGITLYAAIHTLFNAYYHRQRGMYLYFALMSLFGCAYVFTRLLNIHNQSAADFIFVQRLGFLFAQCLLLSQIGFISEYAHWRSRRLILTLAIPTVAILILNLLLPYNIVHSSLPDLRELTLPWGETITDARIFDKTLWWYLQWVIIIAIFGFQFAAALRLRQAGHRQHGNALLFYGGVFFAAILSNFIINHFLFELPLVAEFGFIAMVLLMSMHLNREAHSTRLRAESAESMWSSLTMHAPSFILLIDPDGTIKFINTSLPGDQDDDIIGTHIDEYLRAESQTRISESIQKILASKKADSIRLRLGEPRNLWLDVQLTPFVVTGEVKHVILIATDITEQVAIKERLQQSEKIFRRLLLTLPYGVQVINREGVITFCNPAHDRLFGYEPGQMLGKSIFDLPATAKEQEKSREYIENIFNRHPVPETYTKKDRRKNGETFDIKIDWDYLYDIHGNTIGLISVLTDVTQQLQYETALRDSEEKFRQLAENINQVFFIRDLSNNKMLYVSPAYETIWGRRVNEIYSDPTDFITSIHPDDRSRILGLLNQQNEAGILFDAEYRILDAQGKIHWVHARSYPIHDEQGGWHRIAGFVEEITQRKHVQQQLEDANLKLEQRVQERTAQLSAAHDLLQDVIDSSPDWIFVKDKQHRYIMVNKSFAEAQGLTPGQMLNRPDTDFWSSESCTGNTAYGQRGFHQDDIDALAGASLQLHKLPVTFNDGQVHYFDTYKGPLRDEQGNIYGVLVLTRDITDKVLSEEQQRISHQLLDAVFDNTHVLTAVLDPQMNFIRVNRAYAAADGKAPEYFVGKNHFQLYPDPENERLFQMVVQNGEGIQVAARPFEYEHNPERGVTHWDWTLTPIKDNNGNVTQLVLSLLNVTERIGALENLRRLNDTLEQRVHERTQELKANHDFTETVVNTVGAIIVVLDRNGKIVRFNHACEYLTGYNADDVIGRAPWDFLILPEERAGVKRVFSRLSAGDFPNHYENYWLHKNGSTRLIAWSNTCLSNQAGEVEYIIATGVDITDQRRAEAALRDSAEKYRTLMEHASDVILIADLDGKLIDCNSSALELLGYQRKELLRLSVPDIHPREQVKLHRDNFQTLVNTGSVMSHDALLLRRDGEKIPVDINANIIEYHGRKVAVAFMRDIRARKQLEEQHRQQERHHRAMLVREVHHRIKNNLQGVIGLLRNALGDEVDLDKRSERLIARAITQIGTIAMVHGLQSRFTDGDIRICDITHAIVDQSRKIAPRDTHIEFNDNVTRPALLQEHEAIPLALVINELVTNAIKHIPASHANKQVLVELKGSPAAGMDLLVFNSSRGLKSAQDSPSSQGAGVGLDLIHALLPKQHTRFELYYDAAAGGVFASLRIEPEILLQVVEDSAAENIN